MTEVRDRGRFLGWNQGKGLGVSFVWIPSIRCTEVGGLCCPCDPHPHRCLDSRFQSDMCLR